LPIVLGQHLATRLALRSGADETGFFTLASVESAGGEGDRPAVNKSKKKDQKKRKKRKPAVNKSKKNDKKKKKKCRAATESSVSEEAVEDIWQKRWEGDNDESIVCPGDFAGNDNREQHGRHSNHLPSKAKDYVPSHFDSLAGFGSVSEEITITSGDDDSTDTRNFADKVESLHSRARFPGKILQWLKGFRSAMNNHNLPHSKNVSSYQFVMSRTVETNAPSLFVFH
jgi:hypothetical protein